MARLLAGSPRSCMGEGQSDLLCSRFRVVEPRIPGVVPLAVLAVFGSRCRQQRHSVGPHLGTERLLRLAYPEVPCQDRADWSRCGCVEKQIGILEPKWLRRPQPMGERVRELCYIRLRAVAARTRLNDGHRTDIVAPEELQVFRSCACLQHFRCSLVVIARDGFGWGRRLLSKRRLEPREQL